MDMSSQEYLNSPRDRAEELFLRNASTREVAVTLGIQYETARRKRAAWKQRKLSAARYENRPRLDEARKLLRKAGFTRQEILMLESDPDFDAPEPERDPITEIDRELELSIRASNVITAMGVTTVSDLAKFSKMELLRQKNCGLKTVAEIEMVLASRGYTLQR